VLRRGAGAGASHVCYVARAVGLSTCCVAMVLLLPLRWLLLPLLLASLRRLLSLRQLLPLLRSLRCCWCAVVVWFLCWRGASAVALACSQSARPVGAVTYPLLLRHWPVCMSHAGVFGALLMPLCLVAVIWVAWPPCLTEASSAKTAAPRRTPPHPCRCPLRAHRPSSTPPRVGSAACPAWPPWCR
jgi:hypothetical protein